MFGSISQLQIILQQKKEDQMHQRMLFACFVIKRSVAAALPKQAAHILARPVMDQDKAEVHPCVAVIEKDDDRRAALRKAQKIIGEVIEQSMAETPSN